MKKFIIDVYNVFYPKICLGKHRKHSWEYKWEDLWVGTGDFLDKKEIERKVNRHTRECSECGKKEQWAHDFIGWQNINI